MRTITSLTEAISEAESNWGLSFKIKNSEEACSPCPWCGGRDRFLIFHTGYYMCRPGDGHCAKTGWILEDEQDRLTSIELALLSVAREQAKAKREIEDHERRLSALEKMSKSTDHARYYNNGAQARDYWHSEGINDESIKRWMLGYCQSCHMDYHRRASYTIPVINKGQLRNIRHRIKDASGSDKYRPHMRDLGNTLFYADALLKPDRSIVILWEGEKKAIIGAQHGFDGPAVMGVQGFQEDWAQWFRFDKVYVCYDPDAIEKAAQVASLFGKRGRVVELPAKPDEFLTQGMRQEFCIQLMKARSA